MSNIDNPDASLLKRLYALSYDALLLVAVNAFFVLLPYSLLITFAGLQAHSLFSALAILVVSFVFFGWFWTHGGQTLGMRAWRLRLTALDGGRVSWGMALKRYLLGLPAWLLLITALLKLVTMQEAFRLALIVLALLWWWLDNRAGLWRERYSHTRVVQLEKR